jgi:hypothetical protein
LKLCFKGLSGVELFDQESGCPFLMFVVPNFKLCQVFAAFQAKNPFGLNNVLARCNLSLFVFILDFEVVVEAVESYVDSFEVFESEYDSVSAHDFLKLSL